MSCHRVESEGTGAGTPDRGATPATPFRLAPLVDQISLQERTYRALRAALLEGRFGAGERIVEARVAAMLGVSRVPVREAMRRLQQDGLLEVRPRGGIYAGSIGPDEADDIYRIRGALEGVAAALAAERMSDEELRQLRTILDRAGEAVARPAGETDVVRLASEFHRAIHTGARSPRLLDALESIYAQVARFRTITLHIPGRPEEAVEGHRGLYEAVAGRDAARAETLMRAHVESARLSLRTGTPRGGTTP